MGYHIRVAAFEGPFDLLLDLLEKNQVDIWDIPIATIAKEYLEHVKQMQEQDLVVSGDFLVMAATLLEIKARLLLPRDPVFEWEEEEEDPRERLVGRLLEYKFYKEMAGVLEEKRKLSLDFFPRGYYPEEEKKPPFFKNPIGPISLEQLAKCFYEALHEAKKVEETEEIPREYSLPERLGEIRLLLKREGTLRFRTLLCGCRSSMEVVVTFLVILELVRMREIFAVQRELFGDIHMEVRL